MPDEGLLPPPPAAVAAAPGGAARLPRGLFHRPCRKQATRSEIRNEPPLGSAPPREAARPPFSLSPACPRCRGGCKEEASPEASGQEPRAVGMAAGREPRVPSLPSKPWPSRRLTLRPSPVLPCFSGELIYLGLCSLLRAVRARRLLPSPSVYTLAQSSLPRAVTSEA